MCSGGGDYTPAPTPPTISNPVELQGEAETGAREASRKRRKMVLSSSDTNLTGGAELGSAGGKKTLLGQ